MITMVNYLTCDYANIECLRLWAGCSLFVAQCMCVNFWATGDTLLTYFSWQQAVDVPTMSVQQPMISTQVMMPGAPGMFYPGMQQAPVTYQPVHVPIQPGGQPLPSGQPAVQPAVQVSLCYRITHMLINITAWNSTSSLLPIQSGIAQ